MQKVLDWINLLRVRQWYKNLVVFLAIFFVGNVLQLNQFLLTVFGFVALCLISSAGYIINDLADRQKDRMHPEKKNRPLASGRVSPVIASVVSIMLATIGLVLALQLTTSFFYLALSLFLLTELYTFILKQIFIADILTIASLFVIRAVSGALIIDVKISPWLILCPFFLSLFLSIGKRHADLQLLEDKAGLTRKVLESYTLHFTSSLMIISTTLLIISYSLYSFLSEHQNLLLTLPFGLFIIFRFFYLIYEGSEIARHPEKTIKDTGIVIGIVLWLIVTAILIYKSQMGL